MNAFYGWSISICVSAVIASIFELLVPKGNMEKMFRFVLGTFMVCIVMIPMNSLASSIKNSIAMQKYEYKDTEYNYYVDEQYINSAKGVLSDAVKENLSELGVSYLNIDINIDIDEYTVSGITAEITVSKEYSNYKSKIENTIYNNIGIECKVYIEGND